MPATAIGVRSYLELYQAPDAPMPTNVRVQWSVIGSAVQPAMEESVVPVRTTDRLTAAGQFALETLPPGAYEIRATVFVDGTAIGTVSTTIRKVERGGFMFWQGTAVARVSRPAPSRGPGRPAASPRCP
jgi:hypothetical protein